MKAASPAFSIARKPLRSASWSLPRSNSLSGGTKMAVNNTSARPSAIAMHEARQRRLPVEANILLILVGIALVFEILGWTVIGIIAVGVTQVIITGGIDLSSGSVVGLTAMIAASFAQSSTWSKALYPS